MKPCLIAICLLAFSFGSYAQKEPPIQSYEICKEGDVLLDSGDYKKALAMYEKVDRNDSNYVRSLYGRALSYKGDSQYNKAIQYCLIALKLNDRTELHPMIYNTYANLLDDIGEVEKGLQVFDEAIMKYPAYSKLYFNKGIVLFYKKRYVEAESVFKQTLLVNPYEYSAHYYLGLTAIYQGKIIPAFLSFTGYLLANPGGKYENKCVNILAAMARGKDEVMNYKNQGASGGDENYSLTEEIFLSKIALEKEYKLDVSLDDPIFRQIQVVFEKLEYKPEDPDFWMQYYVPLYKKIFSESEFEPFIFWSFENVNLKDIQDYNKKNKKLIEHVVNETAEYFSLIRATRELDYKKRGEQRIVYYYEKGTLEGRGELSADRQTISGNWALFYAEGNLLGQGNFVNSKRDGEWTYYYFSGKLKAKENMRNGLLNGRQLYFSEHGLLTYDQNYTDGKKNGVQTDYYTNGNISVVANFKDDKLDGDYKEFYPGNQLKTTAHYANGLLSGDFANYYQNGQIKNTGNYQNGKLSGAYKQFHENGRIESEGMYNNDLYEGEWKYFYENGKLQSKKIYSIGKLEGIEENYYEDGPLSDTYTYKKNELNGDARSYTKDQKIYANFLFSGGSLQTAQYFDNSGKPISSSERKNKELHLTAYRADGTKYFQRTLDEKGQITGTETNFYPTGTISSVVEYENGEKNGPSTEYYMNGKKKYEINLKNGKRDGHIVNYYSNGKIQSEGWMFDDEYAGYWNYYDESGTLTTRNYYNNGALNGYGTEYHPNGKVAIERKYYKGMLEELSQFDSTGKLLTYDSFPRFSGKCVLVYPDGRKMQEYNIVNGNIDGPVNSYFYDGSLQQTMFYKGGLLDSSFTQYYYGHTVSAEGHFKAEKKTGLWKYYNRKGILETTQDFSDGELNGWVLLYESGKVTGKIPYRHDERNGESIFTDPDGGLMYSIHYEDGRATGYSYQDKEGKMVTPIRDSQGKLSVKTYYQSGRASRECEYANGSLNGIDRLYYANGKLRSEDHSEYGDFEGTASEYYPNGNPKKINNYTNNQMQGRNLEFNEQGKMTGEFNYNNGKLNGESKIYDDNGRLIETRFYYDGTLLSVKK